MRIQPPPAGQIESPPNLANREQPSLQVQGIKFQYVGEIGLTAIALPSRRLYRFAHPGAVLDVDPRDIASLATIPNLRRI